MTTPVAPAGFTPTVGTGTGGTGAFPTDPMTELPSSYQAYAGATVPGLGHKPHSTTQYGRGGDVMRVSTTGGHTVTVAHALDTLLRHDSSSKILDVQEQLIKAGFLNPSSSYFTAGAVDSSDETYSAYARALVAAVDAHKNLRDVLNERINDPANTTGKDFWSKYQASQNAAASGGTKQVTQTDTTVTNGQDARATAQSVYQSMPGRNVTNKEAQAFQGALDAYEQSHPRTSTETTSGGGASRSIETSGGSNPSQLAEQQVIGQHGEEYAQTQADQVTQIFAHMLSGAV